MLKKVFIALTLCALAACAGAALPHLTPAQTSWASRQWPGTSEEELAGARKTYVMRCSGCHNLVLPERHSMDEWQVLMSSMAVRARLTPDQKAGILRYLAAAKAAP